MDTLQEDLHAFLPEFGGWICQNLSKQKMFQAKVMDKSA